MLNSDELNDLLQQLDADLLKKARIHWVISVLNGEPGPGEIHTQKVFVIISFYIGFSSERAKSNLGLILCN